MKKTIAIAAIALLGSTLMAAAPASSGGVQQSTKEFHADSDGRKLEPNLNPITIGLCNAGLGETVIEHFDSSRDGEISLRCGDSFSGYVHIRERHQSEWQTRVNEMGGGALWDDFMVWTVKNVVGAPGTTVVQSGNKRCYSAPIEMWNVTKYVKTINPTVIVSMNNKKVITAIPTTKHNCKLGLG